MSENSEQIKLCIYCKHCDIRGSGKNEISEYRCKEFPIIDYVAGNDKLPLCSDMREFDQPCGGYGVYWKEKDAEEIERMYIESQDPVAKPMRPGQTFNVEVIS